MSHCVTMITVFLSPSRSRSRYRSLPHHLHSVLSQFSYNGKIVVKSLKWCLKLKVRFNWYIDWVIQKLKFDSNKPKKPNKYVRTWALPYKPNFAFWQIIFWNHVPVKWLLALIEIFCFFHSALFQANDRQLM